MALTCPSAAVSVRSFTPESETRPLRGPTTSGAGEEARSTTVEWPSSRSSDHQATEPMRARTTSAARATATPLRVGRRAPPASDAGGSCPLRGPPDPGSPNPGAAGCGAGGEGEAGGAGSKRGPGAVSARSSSPRSTVRSSVRSRPSGRGVMTRGLKRVASAAAESAAGLQGSIAVTGRSTVASGAASAPRAPTSGCSAMTSSSVGAWPRLRWTCWSSRAKARTVAKRFSGRGAMAVRRTRRSCSGASGRVIGGIRPAWARWSIDSRSLRPSGARSVWGAWPVSMV